MNGERRNLSKVIKYNKKQPKNDNFSYIEDELTNPYDTTTKSLSDEVKSLYGERDFSNCDIEILKQLKEHALKHIKENNNYNFLDSLPMELVIELNKCPLEEEIERQNKATIKNKKEKNVLKWNDDFEIIQNISCDEIFIEADIPSNESKDFIKNLFLSYIIFAENNHLNVGMSELSQKKLSLSISGENAFNLFKYEKGIHSIKTKDSRIDLVISVLQQTKEQDCKININQSDLKIDTYRSSGAGGQHINKTSSAVRITHIPSGIVVTCQDERSQFKNKEKAMKILKSKLEELQRDKIIQEKLEKEKNSTINKKVRTYDLTSNTLIDHRINFKTGINQKIPNLDIEKIITKLQDLENKKIQENLYTR